MQSSGYKIFDSDKFLDTRSQGQRTDFVLNGLPGLKASQAHFAMGFAEQFRGNGGGQFFQLTVRRAGPAEYLIFYGIADIGELLTKREIRGHSTNKGVAMMIGADAPPNFNLFDRHPFYRGRRPAFGFAAGLREANASHFSGSLAIGHYQRAL